MSISSKSRSNYCKEVVGHKGPKSMYLHPVSVCTRTPFRLQRAPDLSLHLTGCDRESAVNIRVGHVNSFSETSSFMPLCLRSGQSSMSPIRRSPSQSQSFLSPSRRPSPERTRDNAARKSPRPSTRLLSPRGRRLASASPRDGSSPTGQIVATPHYRLSPGQRSMSPLDLRVGQRLTSAHGNAKHGSSFVMFS